LAAIVDKVKLRVPLRFLHYLRNFFGAANNEGEANQSARVVYLVSFTLLISLILLSPDKILQILESMQPDFELFGKAQDIIKLFRKMIPI